MAARNRRAAGAATEPQGPGTLRLAEVVASFSQALDLGLGQPAEHFLRSCLLAVRLGETLRLGDRDLADVYYLALLRYAGCTAESHTAAAIFGDDVAANRWLLATDQGRATAVIGALARHLGHGASAPQRARSIARVLTTMPQAAPGVHTAHCEVAQRFAGQLDFAPGIVDALGQMFERWDGRGYPHGIRGAQLALTVQVVQVAADGALFHQLGGVEAAVAAIRERAGGLYDPTLAAHFCRHAPHLLHGLGEESSWDEVLAAEPGPRPIVDDGRFDEAARAIAAVVDLKSPYLTGHSNAVGALAGAAATRCGLPPADQDAIRRAGWLQDLGRIGVSSAIWGKAGPLTAREWERVRLHPYYTERVLARSPALRPLGALAALHHERLDGTGYLRGTPASSLPPGARLLAAADVYQALTEPRPHRPALSPEAAADLVRGEVRRGRLDGASAEAVLASAGHRSRAPRRNHPAGLSDREVEVLRLLARGHANRQIAARLSVSPRTIDHHVEHIFDKVGCSTRAAATFFAMQHNLLLDLPDTVK